jgi:ornithine carbamoyltransferase
VPKHIRSLQELRKDELLGLIGRAIELKEERRAGKMHQQLAGKTIGLIFEKPSTRTRVSFEAAMYGLGGQVIFLSARDTQLARSEPLKDMSRVMSRYVDGMVVRTFGQDVVEELARLCHGAGDQRPDRSSSPLPGPERYDDGTGEERQPGKSAYRLGW